MEFFSDNSLKEQKKNDNENRLVCRNVFSCFNIACQK